MNSRIHWAVLILLLFVSSSVSSRQPRYKIKPTIAGIDLSPGVFSLAKVQEKLGPSVIEKSGDAASSAQKVGYSITRDGKEYRVTFGKGEMASFASIADGRWNKEPFFPGEPDTRYRGQAAALKTNKIQLVFWNGLRLGMDRRAVTKAMASAKKFASRGDAVSYYRDLQAPDEPKDEDAVGVNAVVRFVDGTASYIEVFVGN